MSTRLSDYRIDVRKQEDGLLKLVGLIAQGTHAPAIIEAARAIKTQCADRDDACEVRAVFEAVKYGTPKVPWLAKGFQYVNDPRANLLVSDTYATANAIIKMCRSGACAGDCDEHTVLVASLLGALGFMVGARAWGPGRRMSSEYTHVYAIVAVPKNNYPSLPYTGTAVDTTEPDLDVGDELWPGQGHVMTKWVD